MANIMKNTTKVIKNTLKVGMAITDFTTSAAAEIVTVENLSLLGNHLVGITAAVIDTDSRKLKRDLESGWRNPAKTAKRLREVIWEDE